MDHMKTMFRGQSPYGRGIRNNGIDIDSVPFLGTLVISQNTPVEGEPQILSRIVQCIATKADFSSKSLVATNRLKQLNGEQVIHLLHEMRLVQRKRSWMSMAIGLTNTKNFYSTATKYKMLVLLKITLKLWRLVSA
jgi:hypothetical protein